MKKIILMFFLIVTFSFSLEISSVDPLNFGVVVAGDKSVSLSNVGVYIKGSPGKHVMIIVPKNYDLDGNKMTIIPREEKIILDGSGSGKFRLDIKLNLNNTIEYRVLTDNLPIKVKYEGENKY